MNYIIKHADKETIEKVADLTELVFNDSFVRDTVTKEKDFNYSNVRLLFSGDELASCVFVIPREMYYKGYVLKLGGIGGVATHPNHRKKGYANILMKDAINYMKEEGYDISILYPFKPEFYAKVGYRIFTSYYKVIRKNEVKKLMGNNGYMVRELQEKDLVDIMKIYEIFNKTKIGPVKREENYWKIKLEKNKNFNEKFFVAEKNGKVVGYLILDKIKKDWSDKEYQLKISEYAYLDDINILNSLFTKTLNYVFDSKNFEIVFYEDVLENFDIGRELYKEEEILYKNLKYIKMYKILNMESLLKKIDSVLKSRVNNWNNFIKIKHIEKDYQGKVEIEINDEKIKMDEGDFINILLGKHSIEELKTIEFSKLDDKNIEILKDLFPEEKPVFWDFDYL